MNQPLLLDGPMGTEIDRRGGDTSVPLWSARALIDNPTMIQEIHKDYISSGAQIITTNTFRTQEYTLKKAGVHTHTSREITNKAVMLGRTAIELSENKVKLAGSIAPIEDCYSPYLVPSNTILMNQHKLITSYLYDSGVDLFLVETMNTLREAKIAVTEALNYDLPIYLSFTVDRNGLVLGGTSWADIWQEFRDKVEILMVNCSSTNGTEFAINEFKELNLKKWGFYPNFGEINDLKGWRSHPIHLDQINKIVKIFDLDPTIVGTCCGATPNETKLLRENVNNL